MKKLRETSLKVGDIILTTTTAPASKAIRVATRSDISHAMIYVQDHSVIDATSEGVQARNTQRVMIEDESPIHVFRLRRDLSGEEARRICEYVRVQVGTQYSVKEAIRTALGGAQEWTRKQFCSRLVAQAYAAAGITLVADPNYCSPENLKDSALLIEVEDATLPVTPEEAAFWENRADIPAMMRAAINAVMNGARKKNEDIQNFDDLHAHLMRHPEDDAYMCALLEESGYLNVWKVETDKNPWQYDFDLMNALPSTSGLEEYCWGTLSDEMAGPSRYIVNRGGYAYLSRVSASRFFRMMLDLYDKLAELHRTRVKVATKWLEANDLFEAAAESVLRPHTPEWFAALDLWNPPQAAMTRIAIKSAGSPDVCSICGDDPARDYRLEERHRAAGGVDTMRLCDDCLKIRRAMGEPFVPLREATNAA